MRHGEQNNSIFLTKNVQLLFLAVLWRCAVHTLRHLVKTTKMERAGSECQNESTEIAIQECQKMNIG